MRDFFSRHGKVIVAVVATLAVATAVPTLAAGGFDANNARKVGGHSLKQLSKVTYGVDKSSIDGFDGCHFQTIYTRNAGVPAAGYIALYSTVSAARDTNDPDEAILTTRLMVGSKIVSSEMSVNLENDGTRDATNVNEGVAKVSKGSHVIKIQAEECGDGVAFINDRQIVTEFSPNGLINAPITAKGAATNR